MMSREDEDELDYQEALASFDLQNPTVTRKTRKTIKRK